MFPAHLTPGLAAKALPDHAYRKLRVPHSVRG